MPPDSSHLPPDTPPDRSTLRPGAYRTHLTLVLGRDNKPMAYPLTLLNTQATVSTLVTNRAEVLEWSGTYVLRGEQDPFRLPMVMRLRNYRQDVSLGMPVAYTAYNLYIRDEGRCQYTGRRLSWHNPDPRYCATQDHVVPQWFGGKTEWLNMVLASASSNNRKGHRTLAECGLTLQRKPWVPTAGDMLGLWLTSGVLDELPEAFQPFLRGVTLTERVKRIRDGALYSAA